MVKSRFVTESQKRNKKTKEQKAKEKTAAAARKVINDRMQPVFDRVSPIIQDVLADFAKAREMTEVTISEKFPYIYLKGVGKKGTHPETLHFAIHLDEETATRILIRKPDRWGYVYEDSDLEALAQAIADETEVSSCLTYYDGGYPVGDGDWREGRGEVTTKCFWLKTKKS